MGYWVIPYISFVLLSIAAKVWYRIRLGYRQISCMLKLVRLNEALETTPSEYQTAWLGNDTDYNSTCCPYSDCLQTLHVSLALSSLLWLRIEGKCLVYYGRVVLSLSCSLWSRRSMSNSSWSRIAGNCLLYYGGVGQVFVWFIMVA